MQEFTLPDYHTGSIVNLMASVAGALGAGPTGYAPLAELPVEQLQQSRKLLLLVIDGVGSRFLQQYARGGFLHRHMRREISSVCPSTTATAIPAFLTGVAPLQHGFTGWFEWFRELGSVLAVLPFRARHGGGPITTAGVTPLVLSGAPPLLERVRPPSHVIMPEWIADSVFNRAFSANARVHPYDDIKEFFKSIEKALSKEDGPAYIYAYWPNYDTISHQYGPQSPQAVRHFAALDTACAELLPQLKAEAATMLVTADHGFLHSPPERTIHLEDHPRLAECLTLPLCGEPRLAWCYVRPDRREAFERYVREELAHCTRLLPSRELLARGWLGLGQGHPEIAHRIGDYALVMRENYKIKDWVLGEKRFEQLGVHGGLSELEMLVPLVVV